MSSQKIQTEWEARVISIQLLHGQLDDVNPGLQMKQKHFAAVFHIMKALHKT
jgi:hypothetical protein